MSDATKILNELKTAFAAKSPDLKKCQALVDSFKLALLKLPVTPPFNPSDPAVRQHLVTARDGFEVAVLLSLHLSDLAAFELNFQQLKPYYFDFASVLPESSQKWPVLGLRLLSLLAESRIAEFHTELELLPVASHGNQFISYAIALEQELMEGSYRSLWDASSKVPFPEYRFFVDHLVSAARDNIAECSEKAYRELTPEDAIKLLKLSSTAALSDFCAKRGWELKNNVVHFRPVVDQTFFIPSKELIKQGLGYATELERIV